jgi:hypothetical protein
MSRAEGRLWFRGLSSTGRGGGGSRSRARNIARLSCCRARGVEISGESGAATSILMVGVVLRISDDGIEALAIAGILGEIVKGLVRLT